MVTFDLVVLLSQDSNNKKLKTVKNVNLRLIMLEIGLLADCFE